MVVKQGPDRAAELSFGGARMLARERAEQMGWLGLADEEERPWGWAFHRAVKGVLPGGAPFLLVVYRDGTIDVPPNFVTVEFYDRGLWPPRPGEFGHPSWRESLRIAAPVGRLGLFAILLFVFAIAIAIAIAASSRGARLPSLQLTSPIARSSSL
jgi:hypothetical protein